MGKVIVAGSFTTFNDVSQKYITLLDSEGNIDLNLQPRSRGEQRNLVGGSSGKRQIYDSRWIYAI
jgi:hypothetical protein